MRTRSRLTGIAALLAAAVAVAGCGSSSSSPSPQKSGSATTGKGALNPNAAEVNPAGDIPDNQAYVAYAPASAGFSVKVPEGWARTTSAAGVAFTDKLNGIEIQTLAARVEPTTGDARRTEVPKLAKRVAGFQIQSISRVTRSAGPAVRIDYLAQSPADPVTGKRHTNAVERYTFFHNGRDVVLTLSGPKQADNVDPWKIVTNSLRYTR